MTALLETHGLKKLYPVQRGFRRAALHAVDGVDLRIDRGECVGLVGESGCGKSTLARLVAGLAAPSDGDIQFAEGARVQVVFQDPHESLNPSFTAFACVADPVQRLWGLRGATLEQRVLATFDDVGLPRELARRYPHQLSGGQKARVGIARALSVDPELIILDEPTSALDVSVQATILKLLGELRARRGVSYLFVTHDLEVVRLVCDRIVVMYLGRIVESAPSEALLNRPAHPYTRALLAASPDPARRGVKVKRLEGAPQSPVDPDPHVCRFAGRCPLEIDICRRASPPLLPFAEGHLAACHRVGETGA